jgi:enediyne biosynthesis protein E4
MTSKLCLPMVAMEFALLVAQSLAVGPTSVNANAQSHTCVGRPVPRLVDVTAQTGIHFKHTLSLNKTYIPDVMSGGVLLIDYDRDGWVDIYFTNAPTVAMAIAGTKARGSLYHNNHDGTFTDVTDTAKVATPCIAMGGSVGDYNNDGWPDMYITCLGGNVLYRNNGDGTFTDVAKQAGVKDGRWSTGSSFGDYDGDGFVDLMVTNYVDFHLDHLPDFGRCQYRGIDVHCLLPKGMTGAGDSLFHNNGDETFTDVSRSAGVDDRNGYYGLTTVWSDFENIGRPSIFVANDKTPNYLYRNDGNGKFTDIGAESGTAVNTDGKVQGNMGVAIGDYLHTGRPSIYVTTFFNEYKVLYRNDGNWNFTDVTYAAGIAGPSLPYVGWGTWFVDLDNDGWLDLIAVNGHVYPQADSFKFVEHYKEPGYVFLNEKNGAFCEANSEIGNALAVPHASRGLVVGDLFNDGQMDAVYSDLDGAPTVLRNQGIPGQHWVSFELAGVKSNRLAIGAKLKLTAGGTTQTEEIHSGGSYLSQNDLRVHFGLGKAAKIDLLEIRWPSGSVETIRDLKADKFYSVLEGSGIVDRARIIPTAKPGS